MAIYIYIFFFLIRYFFFFFTKAKSKSNPLLFIFFIQVYIFIQFIFKMFLDDNKGKIFLSNFFFFSLINFSLAILNSFPIMEDSPILKKGKFTFEINEEHKEESKFQQDIDDEPEEIIKRLSKIFVSIILEYTIINDPMFNINKFIKELKDDICIINLSIKKVCENLDVLYVAFVDFLLDDLKDVNFSQLCFCDISNNSISDFKKLEKSKVNSDYSFIYSIIKRNKNHSLGRSLSKDYTYDNNINKNLNIKKL